MYEYFSYNMKRIFVGWVSTVGLLLWTILRIVLYRVVAFCTVRFSLSGCAVALRTAGRIFFAPLDGKSKKPQPPLLTCQQQRLASWSADAEDRCGCRRTTHTHTHKDAPPAFCQAARLPACPPAGVFPPQRERENAEESRSRSSQQRSRRFESLLFLFLFFVEAAAATLSAG